MVDMKNSKKVKTFQVSEIIHDEIVRHCNEHCLKINQFVEKLLTNAMRNLNESTKPRTE